MIDINLNKITKNFGENLVLNNINLNIQEKDKIAIIGENGSGKTTLLNIIAGTITEDTGKVSIRKGATIGYLRQNIENKNDSLTVKDILYSGVQNIINLKEKLEKLEQKLTTTSNNLDDIILKYTKVQQQFIDIGGYEIDIKIEKIVSGFKIDKNLYNRKFNTLSGGEKTLITFASIIISNPDILLLDEPTNHLDIETLEWLEKYLASYKGTIILVSHDRYFIDKVTNKIILLENGDIEIFNGNYSYYIEENDKRILNEFKKYKDQQKLIEAMERKIKQLQEFGKLGDNGIFFKRAESIRKRLEKLEKLSKPKEEKKLPLSFSNSKRSSNVVLDLNDINIEYPNKVILSHANMKINYQEKVCLIGNNGCGKTSLLKYLLNENLFSSNVSIGYIPQEISFDNMNITIYEEARKYFDGEEHHLRSTLCKFYFFKEDINKKLSVLSGGEKVRLKLFCLMQKDFNLLILDEPTNHIDIETREILEKTLQEYNGTVLFISHDRYFINNLATKIIYFDNKKLRYLVGNYDYYKNNKHKYMS